MISKVQCSLSLAFLWTVLYSASLSTMEFILVTITLAIPTWSASVKTSSSFTLFSISFRIFSELSNFQFFIVIHCFANCISFTWYGNVTHLWSAMLLLIFSRQLMCCRLLVSTMVSFNTKNSSLKIVRKLGPFTKALYHLFWPSSYKQDQGSIAGPIRKGGNWTLKPQ